MCGIAGFSGDLPVSLLDAFVARLGHRGPDDHGTWQHLETFIRERSDADFTHSICDACEQDVMRGRPRE